MMMNSSTSKQYLSMKHSLSPLFTQHRVGTGDTGMRTLGKHVLQIEVEVFHAVATTTEHGEDGPYNLAVLIAYQLTAKS